MLFSDRYMLVGAPSTACVQDCGVTSVEGRECKDENRDIRKFQGLIGVSDVELLGYVIQRSQVGKRWRMQDEKWKMDEESCGVDGRKW